MRPFLKMDSIQAARELNDIQFREWYSSQLRNKRGLYFSESEGPRCDRCKQRIVNLRDLRLMFGRRLHYNCFVQDYKCWVKQGEAKGYVDPNAEAFFKRVIDATRPEKFMKHKF